MPRVVIIGAGISGLAVAYQLQASAPALEVVVLEKNGRPGGIVWTEDRAGFRVETGPNGFLDTNPSTLGLCRDLGLGPALVPAGDSARRNRYLFVGGRLRRLPVGPLGLVTTDLLSLRGKLALLSEPWRRPRPGPGDESVDAFVRRRAGAEAADLLADALVTGVHAGDPARLSMQAAFPRVARMEAEDGSILRGMLRASRRRARQGATAGRLWSLRPGLRALTEALAERLSPAPAFGVTVRRIDFRPDASPRWTVRGEGADAWPADAVVLACPAYQQAAVVADLDPALADAVHAIPYNRVAVVALGFRRAELPREPDGFGYIVPQRQGGDVLGVQWCSSVFPGRAPEGSVLFRALCGGWNRPEIVNWDDERLAAAVRAEMTTTLGIHAPPVLRHVVRWDKAIPQYHLGHLARVGRIEAKTARHPGLFLGGNAYHGVALNDCVERAAVLAEQVAQALPPQSP